MRQLDAIARTGTVSAAAREMHLSQPALSRSMKRLEKELGAPLFARSGRRLELNEAGRAALEWARQLLRDERLMRDAVAAAARRARALRVGTVAPAPLWRLTGLMMEAFPRETLTSETADEEAVVRGVIDQVFDLGIVCTAPPSPLVRSCELMHERLSISLPPNHPLSSRRSVRLAELAENSFLILTGIGFWRDLVEHAIPHAAFIEQDDRMVFSQLARTTPHCTFVTDAPYMENSTPSGRVVVPIEDDAAQVTFHLIARSGAAGLAAQLFNWVSSGDRSGGKSA